MDAHIAEAAGTEIPPAAPFEGNVGGMIRTQRRWPQPQVPIQRRRHGRRIGGSLDALRPPAGQSATMGRPVRPDMHLAHRSNAAVGKPFVDEPIALECHALISHLRSHLRLARRESQRARFLHRARERLLAINVFAELERHHAGRSMVVVRYADHDGVQGFLAFQQLAVIPIALRGGKLQADTVEIGLIHIAERDHVDFFRTRDVIDVITAAARNADEGDVQFVVGRETPAITGFFGSREQRRRKCQGGDGFGGAGQKAATRDGRGFDLHLSKPMVIEWAAKPLTSQRSGELGTMSVCSAGLAARLVDSGRPSSRRTMFVPWTMAAVLKKAMSRLHPCRPNPQSLDTINCSGAIYFKAWRMEP